MQHCCISIKKVLILTKTKGLCQFLKILSRNSDRSSKNFRIYSIDQFVKQTADRLSFAMNNVKRGATDDELKEHFDVYTPQMCTSLFDKFPDAFS